MAACLGGHARNDDHEAGHQDTRGLQHRPAPGGEGGHTVQGTWGRAGASTEIG